MRRWLLRLGLMMAVVNFQLPTPNSQGEPLEATGRESLRRLHVGGLGPVHDTPIASVGRWNSGIDASIRQDPPPKVKPSQHGTVLQRISETTITIDYNRPVARGRELFGTLVPFGRIWCPGADDATTVEVSTAVKFDGQDLPAGKYSLWTEPQPERWTVIFNKNHAVWHTRYPAGQDALRLQITPRTGSHMETLAFYFPVVDGRKGELVLHWGTVVVPLSIEVP